MNNTSTTTRSSSPAGSVGRRRKKLVYLCWTCLTLVLLATTVQLVHGDEDNNNVDTDETASAQLFFEGLNETDPTSTSTSQTTSTSGTATTTTEQSTINNITTTLEDEEDVLVEEEDVMVTPISTTEILYDLPSFSLTLQVSKNNNRLVSFQDELQKEIQYHLEEFFKSKLDTMQTTASTSTRMLVQNVGLSSHIVWRELTAALTDGGSMTTTSSATTTPTTNTERTTVTDDDTQNQSIEKAYEVRGSYDCDLSLLLERYHADDDATEDSSSSSSGLGVSSTLMNLFFIEAFQGENYWDLIYRFLSNDELRNIHDVMIVVQDDGFKPYHHGLDHYQVDDDWYNNSDSSPNISKGAIVGLAFGTLITIAMIGGAVYIFCIVQGSSLHRLYKITFAIGERTGGSGSSSINDDKGSETDDACTNSSSEPNENDDDNDDDNNDEESGWLDAWANSITSIPIRDPSFHRKKRRGKPTVQPFVRPAHEAMSSLELDCIDEVDNETVTSDRTSESKTSASSAVTPRRSNKTKTKNHHNNNKRRCGAIAEERYCDNDDDSSTIVSSSSSSTTSTTMSSKHRYHKRHGSNNMSGDGGLDDEVSLSSGVTIWDDATSVNSQDTDSLCAV
jgi:trimeric autotransporter adhesin